MEWLAGYIKWMLDYKITYVKPAEGDMRQGAGLKPGGHVDADYAGCLDTRRSTSGYLFLMASALVAWSSKRQAMVASSMVEAE